MKQLRYILALGAVSLGATLGSCTKDETVSLGDPEIISVKYKITDTTTIDKGAFGEWLLIQGNNLNGVDSIHFNDVRASDYYIESTLISVCVPRKLPQEDTQSITLFYGGKSVAHKFPIEIPKFRIDGLYNEWSEPGDTVTLVGANFDIYEADSNARVEFTDNVGGVHLLKVLGVGEKYLTFEVPEENTERAKMRLIINGKNIQRNDLIPGRFRDNRNMLYTHDEQVMADAVLTDGVGKAGYPKAINGAYAVLKGNYTAWAFGAPKDFFPVFNGPIAVRIWENAKYGSVWDGDSYYGNTADLEVKFEINVLKPWNGNAIKFALFNRTAVYEPHAGGSFSTSGWMTVAIPFRNFVDGDNKYLEELTGALDWGWTWNTMSFHGGINVTDQFICWDNFRIVRRDSDVQ